MTFLRYPSSNLGIQLVKFSCEKGETFTENTNECDWNRIEIPTSNLVQETLSVRSFSFEGNLVSRLIKRNINWLWSRMCR